MLVNKHKATDQYTGDSYSKEKEKNTWKLIKVSDIRASSHLLYESQNYSALLLYFLPGLLTCIIRGASYGMYLFILAASFGKEPLASILSTKCMATDVIAAGMEKPEARIKTWIFEPLKMSKATNHHYLISDIKSYE